MSSFQPFFSASEVAFIVDSNASLARDRFRTVCEDALLQHFLQPDLRREVMARLLAALAQPYRGHVSIPFYKVAHTQRMEVEGHGGVFYISTLLRKTGRVLETLNRGLGPKLRIVSGCSLLTFDLYLEFWPEGISDPSKRPPVMNPEDEEEVEVPMAPRSLSFDSE